MVSTSMKLIIKGVPFLDQLVQGSREAPPSGIPVPHKSTHWTGDR